MPHLVRERRAVRGTSPSAQERRSASRARRWSGVLPEADFLELTLASMAYRLARFGLDADAGPLLVCRKRSN